VLCRRIGFLWALILLSACDGSGGGGDRKVTVVVSPTSANLFPGETITLTANFENVTWTSRNPAIATVDTHGNVTAVKVGVVVIVATLGGAQGAATIGVVSLDAGASDLSVSGTARYEDRPFSARGFTGDVEPKPIAGAVVRLIAIDGFVPLASSGLGPDGAFSFSGLDNTGRHGGVYVQVQAKTPKGEATPVEIRNNETDRALYALASASYDDSLKNTFIANPTAKVSDIGGAFNLFDTLLTGSRFIVGTGACPTSGTGCAVPTLTAYWEADGGVGTHFDDRTEAIHVCGRGCAGGDADEYDDGVISHEHGHFVLHHYASDDSPGGLHFLGDHTQDIRLSWSEGWATFFSSVARNSALHVDTNDQGLLSFEVEGISSFNGSVSASQAIYTTNETAVAAVLWDAFDAPSADDDPLALGFLPSWEAVLSMASPTSIESFQRRFANLHTGTDTFADDLQTALKTRKIELFPDAGESNGEAFLEADGPTQHHTLYRTAGTGDDEDVVPFNVVRNAAYTLETYNLTNGADTFLTITDAGGRLIFDLENDNRSGLNHQACSDFCPPNDETALSSSLLFSWPDAATTLYAHVKRAPHAPPSAGKFGSYDLRLRRR